MTADYESTAEELYWERWKTIRERSGLTAEEVCVAIGVSRGTLSRYENGHCQPPFAVGTRLCATLGIDPASMVKKPV